MGFDYRKSAQCLNEKDTVGLEEEEAGSGRCLNAEDTEVTGATINERKPRGVYEKDEAEVCVNYKGVSS